MPPLLRSCLRAFFATILAVQHAHAQQPAPARYLIDRWNTDAGLPQNAVNAILQSREGYLWIATSGGIARFDGTAFTVITTGDRTGLRSDVAVALSQSRDGAIWIATTDGLTRYERGTLKTLTTRDGLQSNSVDDVAAHPDGSVWISSGGAVSRLDSRGTLRLVVPAARGLGTVNHIAIDAAGAVWLSASTGIFRLSGADNEVVRAADQRSGAPASILEPDPVRGVWAVTDSGIARLTTDGIELFPVRAVHALSSAGAQTVRAISAFGHDIWIATIDARVWQLNPASGTIAEVSSGETGALISMIVDREGSVWTGNRVTGLARIHSPLFHVLTTDDGLAGDNLISAFADRRGRVFLGANCAGWTLIDGARIQSFKTTPASGCAGPFAEDAEGVIWIGGSRIGRWSDGAVQWFTDTEGLPARPTHALLRARNGTMWIGSADGLRRWDGTRFILALDSTRASRIRALYETRDGALWIGTETGLVRYANGATRTYKTADGLPHNYVRAIYEDDTGSLWIGTYGGGLARMRGSAIQSFTTLDGLYDNFISSIAEDGAGNLWLSANRGVFRVARRDLDQHAAGNVRRLRIVAYGRKDGMLSSETNGGYQSAVARTPDGRLWYPTLHGVVVIDPATGISNVAPAVAVERVTANGSIVDVKDDIDVGPGTSDIEILYSGLSLSSPGTVTFRYKLDGWDDDWVDAGTRRTAYYSRLRPGSYQFSVAAANRDGVWSDPRTVLQFTVRPTLLQTWWFRAILVLAVACLAWLAYKARLRQVRRVTESRERETAGRRITQILESITDGFIALDADWRFTYMNHTAEGLLGHPGSDYMGRTFWECFPRAQNTIMEEQLRRVHDQRTPAKFEAPDTPAYGRWIEVHAYPSDDGVAIYFSDITTRKDAEHALLNLSLRDELTGAYNRRGFLEHAEQLTTTVHRSGRGFHIVFIDMDGMKTINDTLGHKAGDRALLETVDLLKRTFRESDIIGRLGGDEFAVIVPESTDALVEMVCSRLHDHLADLNLTPDRSFNLALSIGVSSYDPLNPVPITELIEIADQRMYEEKRAKGSAR